jgi:hypothetical protein
VIAALYVQKGGCYSGLPDVDLWDESRDARLYAGPHPVVAHPPCSAWCRLAGLVEARWGHKRGEDGGCFAAALDSVRRWGGILEHPADSWAWRSHGLLTPSKTSGWATADWQGGWTCHIEQAAYGCPARKATWLYAYGVDLPQLRWGKHPSSAVVSWCRNRFVGDLRRIGKSEAAATPPEFRDLLLSIAATAKVPA